MARGSGAVTPGDESATKGLIDRVQRVVVHALGALRCYITMVLAEGERRGRRLLDEGLWVLLLAGIGVVGIALFASGVAQWIESRLGVPGAGSMIVGMAVLVVFLAVALARILRWERGQ
jgi:hypothetical protein